MSDTHQINSILLQLHGGCRRQPREIFKNWALALTRSLVSFEKSTWGSGVIVNGNAVLFGAHLSGIGADFERRHNEHSGLDKRSLESIHRLGVTLIRDGHDPADTPLQFRRSVLDPEDIRYGLYTTDLQRSTGVFNALVLMRGNDSHPFTERERGLVEVLAPHLFQADNANRIERANDILDDSPREVHHTIVAMRDGLVVAAHDEAISMLLEEWPDWQGGRLPDTLLDTINSAITSMSDPRGFLVQGQKLVVRLHVGHDQVLVRLRAPCAVDTLGRRELSVAQRFSQGESYKEIAKSLQVSPSTVSNQLTAIYSKLCVSNKIQLHQVLEKWR
jgi:DNA-binding CsgD family transcriptional regulator